MALSTRACVASLLLVGCFEPTISDDSDDTGGTGDPTTTPSSTDPTTSSTSPTSTNATTTTSPTSTTDDTTTSETNGSTDETSPPDSSSSESGAEEESSSTGVVDTDGDGVPDGEDNCLEIENDDQSDIDSDGTGDWCDTEVINDGDRIYIPEGVDQELYGILCITGEVRIYGNVTIPPLDPGVFGTGAMLLLTPGRVWIAETGAISARGTGEMGGAPSPTLNRGGMMGSGGGPGCGGGPGQCVGQGGAGGGYGGSGGLTSQVNPHASACDVCNEPTIGHCFGAPGPTFGSISGSDISFGSGGGAAGNSCECTSSGGRGGRGGGGVLIVSEDSIRVDGSIAVDGEQPPEDASGCGWNAGGGGGSGGGIALAAPIVEGGASGLLTARGGDGANSVGDGADWGWSGGGGGGGRIKLFGNSDDWLGTTDTAGGVGGTVPAGANSYVGEAGSDGSFGSSPMIPADYSGVCP